MDIMNTSVWWDCVGFRFENEIDWFQQQIYYAKKKQWITVMRINKSFAMKMYLHFTLFYEQNCFERKKLFWKKNIGMKEFDFSKIFWHKYLLFDDAFRANVKSINQPIEGFDGTDANRWTIHTFSFGAEENNIYLVFFLLQIYELKIIWWKWKIYYN